MTINIINRIYHMLGSHYIPGMLDTSFISLLDKQENSYDLYDFIQTAI